MRSPIAPASWCRISPPCPQLPNVLDFRAVRKSAEPRLYARPSRAYSSADSGGGSLHGAIQAFRYVNIVAYTGLGLVAFVFWRRRRDRASMWAAATFGSL